VWILYSFPFRLFGNQWVLRSVFKKEKIGKKKRKKKGKKKKCQKKKKIITQKPPYISTIPTSLLLYHHTNLLNWILLKVVKIPSKNHYPNPIKPIPPIPSIWIITTMDIKMNSQVQFGLIQNWFLPIRQNFAMPTNSNFSSVFAGFFSKKKHHKKEIELHKSHQHHFPRQQRSYYMLTNRNDPKLL